MHGYYVELKQKVDKTRPGTESLLLEHITTRLGVMMTRIG